MNECVHCQSEIGKYQMWSVYVDWADMVKMSDVPLLEQGLNTQNE
jgi:hypothetical protein